MRYTAGRLNRVWLTIIGIILLGGGAMATGIGLGVLDGAALYGLRAPGQDQPVLLLAGDDPVLAGVLTAVGTILGLLAVLWLLAQVPRKRGASTLKLEDPDGRGLTVLRPTLLEDAISSRVEELDDVTGAKAVVRGSSRTPDITIRVITTCHADIPRVVRDVEERIRHDLQETLGQEPAALAIGVDVRADSKKDGTVTLEAVPLRA
ncbi:alkaline shock response membrane anchor protein AmaP [Arthrobacter sp. Soc17.1.1.1]|uniref:alkaline shock response membrane anchor protein AmaP n=1 Tax=Arthrobacter sp. Soc17.1.1.1 TaxID=3121277 RepID=UPI002FE4A882